jgi:hypothetical protein
MRQVTDRLDPQTALGMVDWKEQFLYQADRRVATFGYRRVNRLDEAREAIQWLNAAPGRWVLLPEERLTPCFDPQRAVALGQAHRELWFLVRADMTRPCDEGQP